MPSGRKKRGRPPVEGLTGPQQRVLLAIRDCCTSQQCSPTLAELAKKLSITIPSVSHLVTQLVQKGYVAREKNYSRSLRILKLPEPPSLPELSAIPLLGRVTAGVPLLAIQNQEESIYVESSLVCGKKCYALKVKGTSMIQAGIQNGDIVIVSHQPAAHSGDIVVAMIGEEATVKRLVIQADHVELHAANPAIGPRIIDPDQPFQILGKVIGIRHV